MRILFALLALATAALAQTKPGSGTPSPTATPTPTPTPAPATRTLWKCTLPGGSYQVLVSAILSVSSHEYVVDGAARVTEVNIDTAGQFAVRFYYIEPAVTSGPNGIGAATFGKVQSILTDAAERSGTDAWKKVVKSYPVTTHARTVEYRVGDKDSLTKIFISASNSQATGKADSVTVSD
ncbi:MAG: hypothetical protein ABI318_16625 [Chthoniobacteraceae bacterium]